MEVGGGFRNATIGGWYVVKNRLDSRVMLKNINGINESGNGC